MEYFIVWLEGIASFISPCVLPMLPIYISYFGGQENSNKKALTNSLGFVLGFTLIFTILGALSGAFGNIIKQYQTIFNITFGVIIILFGFNFMDVIKIPFLNKTKQIQVKTKQLGFFSSIIFGIAFAISWTPCIGAFLGSALLLVTIQGETWQGIIMLLLFSLGLGIPFVITSLLIEKLKTTFDFIKKHYKIINRICGIFLIIIGLLMMTGCLNYWLAMFNI